MTGTQFDSVILWLTANAISIFIGLVILVAGWVLANIAHRTLRATLDGSVRMDKTIAPLLADVTRYGILAVATIMALNQMGVQTTSILAVIGAAGLAIALALQGTLSNIAAGVMLIWLRPIATGEYIDADGIAGTVVEIGLFATRLRAADGVYVFAPNSTLWNRKIANYSREKKRRFDLKVGISYSDDMSKARDVLMKIGKDERVLADPEAVVYVSNLGESAVEMMLRVWVKTADYWPVLFDFTERAKRDFDTAGLSIPFNQLDVNLPADKPAALAAQPAKAASPARTSRAKAASKPKAG
jgi:small conductance mechanosensitive channel